MGQSRRVDVFSADFITGSTYIGMGPKSIIGGGIIWLTPYIVVSTSDLLESDYKKAAVRRFEEALRDESLLVSEVPLCPKGRITFCKLETITISD